MNGWQVLHYIFYAGLVFVGLWIIGTNLKEGLWGNALLFCNWCIATYIAWIFFFPSLKVVLSMLKADASSQLLILAVAMALFWGLFLVPFIALRSATDALSKVKINFHPIADKAGAVAFALLLIGGFVITSWPVKLVLDMGE
jgi:hypothetical protein